MSSRIFPRGGPWAPGKVTWQSVPVLVDAAKTFFNGPCFRGTKLSIDLVSMAALMPVDLRFLIHPTQHYILVIVSLGVLFVS